MTEPVVPAVQGKPSGGVTATIPAGQALSNVVDITTGKVNLVIMPSAWTGAYLTLQVSIDNVLWGDVWEGTSEAIRQVFPSSAFVINPDVTAHVLYLRFRSGTRDKLVPQEAERVFQLSVSA